MKLNRYFKQTQIRAGVKLLVASVFLICGNFIGAAIALIIPTSFGYNPFILATGDIDDEAILLEKITKQVKRIVKESQGEAVDEVKINKAIENLNAEIAKLSNEAMAELNKKVIAMGEANEALQKEIKAANEAIVAQSTEIKKLGDKADVTSTLVKKTFRGALEDAFKEHKDVLQEVKDLDGTRLSLKKYFEGKGNNTTTPTMTIKAAVDMFESNITTDNYVNLLRLTQLDPQRVSIPLTIYPHVMDTFQVKGITRPYMSLLVVHTYFDGSATKTEGAASGQSSFKFKTIEFKSFFIATYFTLSDETLDDLNEALDEISLVAPDKILDQIDSKILSTGGDDATDIKGILTSTKSTAFVVPAAFVGTVANPNLVDLVVAMQLQAWNNKYRPNVVMLNNGDVAVLAAQKNNFADSKVDRRVQFDSIGNPVAISGMRIVQNAVLPANSALVYDNSLPWIGRRRDMTMTLGYNGTDLTEGQRTLVINIRVAFGVRDPLGIIYSSDNAANIVTL